MKRFTETDKWTDNFFADLLPVEKLAWLYILDNCDAAGVIEVPGKVANFLIGENIDWEAFMLTLADLGKLQQIENRKFWVTNFLRVQHRGGISATAPKHAYVRQSISRYNLPVSIQDFVQSTNSVPTKKQPSSNRVPTEYVPSTYKDKDKATDKDKGIVKGKKTLLPNDWQPKNPEYAAEHGLDPQGAIFEFKDWATRRGKKYTNWEQTFQHACRNWLQDHKIAKVTPTTARPQKACDRVKAEGKQEEFAAYIAEHFPHAKDRNAFPEYIYEAFYDPEVHNRITRVAV